jgi:hypothetical protein
LAVLVSGSPSLLTATDLSYGTLVSRAPMLSAVSMGRVSWFPVSLPPLVPQAVRKRWFPAPPLCLRLQSVLSHWPAMRPCRCFPSLRTAAPLSRCRHVSAPSYPWTLELRLGRQTAIAWNAPGLANPSSLVETGDQLVLKRLNPAFEAPLISPPSGML